MKRLAAAVLTVIVTTLAIGFINWSFDFGAWTEGQRAVLVALNAVCAALAAIYPGFD